jgi:hypothetical protein
MALLTKEELMKPVAMNMSTFEIWGGEILVWEMNGRERQIWQKKSLCRRRHRKGPLRQ